MISPQVKILPFAPEHLEMFDLGGTEAKAQVARAAEAGEFASAFTPQGMLGLGGVVPILPGVAEAWLAAAPLARRYPLALTQAAARFLDRAVARHRLRRLQAAVLAGHPTAHRWIGLLGFEKEAVLRRFGPAGQDFVLYARIRQ